MIEIRRILSQVEDILHESGPAPAQPLRRGWIAVVLTNPYAGRYVEEITPMMDALNPVGVDLARQLQTAMDVPVERIEGYGKGSIVGSGGELEHGALWHVPGGYAMRELLGWKGDLAAYRAGKGAPATGNAPAGGQPVAGQPGNALSIVPSTKKVGRRARRSTSRSRTSMPAMCAAISMPSRCACRAHPRTMNSSSFWR